MASPVTSGYDQEFLDPPDKLKEFECALCLLVTREPNQTSCCGHDFCQSCINRVLTDRKPCPLCKEATFSIFLDKKQRRKVLELKVRCSMMGHGCDWTGELRNLATHTNTRNGKCQFVDVICPNNCGESHQRRHLDNHLSDTCRNRPFTCVYCKYESTYELVIKHHDQCDKFPLDCPNKCEIGSVERNNMAEHLSECPLQLVECEYAHAGCSEKIQRKDLAMHMEQSVQKHLLWAFAASQKRIVALEEMQRRMEMQVKTMRQELDQHLEEKDHQIGDIRMETDRKLAEKDQQIKLLTNRVSILEKHVPVPIAETQTNFTVVKYSEQKGTYTDQHGLVLYTQPREAKLQVRIFFYASGLYARLYQLPGEFDEEIQWPVKCTVTVFLLNQLNDRDHINTGCKALSLARRKEKAHIKSFDTVNYATVEDHSKVSVQYLKGNRLKFLVIV